MLGETKYVRVPIPLHRRHFETLYSHPTTSRAWRILIVLRKNTSYLWGYQPSLLLNRRSIRCILSRFATVSVHLLFSTSVACTRPSPAGSHCAGTTAHSWPEEVKVLLVDFALWASDKQRPMKREWFPSVWLGSSLSGVAAKPIASVHLVSRRVVWGPRQ